MIKRQLQLTLLKDKYGVCMLPNTTPIPDWALMASLVSITRTKKELTIVCRQDLIPTQCQSDLNWRCFRVDGSFDLNQIGVISSISLPLAQNGISIYVISTYETDYFLVQEEKVEQTISVLSGCGHQITRQHSSDIQSLCLFPCLSQKFFTSFLLIESFLMRFYYHVAPLQFYYLCGRAYQVGFWMLHDIHLSLCDNIVYNIRPADNPYLEIAYSYVAEQKNLCIPGIFLKSSLFYSIKDFRSTFFGRAHYRIKLVYSRAFNRVR